MALGREAAEHARRWTAAAMAERMVELYGSLRRPVERFEAQLAAARGH
jgi:hypothetical protein